VLRRRQPRPQAPRTAVYRELGEQDPRFRHVWRHWDRHRLEQTQWFRVAEDSRANYVAVATSR
jgi:TRAP-type mannitol/chloroaromatic compound transport system substrate-binding protein